MMRRPILMAVAGAVLTVAAGPALQVQAAGYNQGGNNQGGQSVGGGSFARPSAPAFFQDHFRGERAHRLDAQLEMRALVFLEVFLQPLLDGGAAGERGNSFPVRFVGILGVESGHGPMISPVERGGIVGIGLFDLRLLRRKDLRRGHEHVRLGHRLEFGRFGFRGPRAGCEC